MELGTTLDTYKPKPTKPNLTQEEQQALKSLQDANLIVCRADKGSTTVVMPTTMYVTLCLDHLQNKDTYEIVTQIPDIQQVLTTALDPIAKDLHKRLRKQLRTSGNSTPNLYGLPKLHKNPLKIIPIQVVSSILSPTYYWLINMVVKTHLAIWR